MAKNWYSRVYETGELNVDDCYQPIVLNEDVSIIGIRISMILFNNPVMTGLQCHVYTDRSGIPDRLIMSSTNTYDTADLTDLGNAARQFNFEFTPKHFNSTNTFHVCLSATTYTGTDASHVAWVLAFPDPVYTADVTNEIRYLGQWPQEVLIIGAKL